MKHLTVSELSAKSNDFFCIVVVVASEKPRLAPQKFVTAKKRFVQNFTVKDHLNESINVTCWGDAEFVIPIANLCTIGAFLRIFNGRIRPAGVTIYDQLYFPSTTSLFKMDLVEKVSLVTPYESDEGDETTTAMLVAALCTPFPSASRKIGVEELLINPIYTEGDSVTAVVVVTALGCTTNLNTKDGRCVRRKEVKVTDKSTRSISLILWDSVLQTFADQWTPFRTVLHLTDVKIAVDKYLNKKMLVASSRTICTADPDTEAGRDMLAFATSYLANSEIFARTIQPDVVHFNRKEARRLPTVSALHKLITAQAVESGTSQQVVLSCFVSSFQLNTNQIIFTKCGSCGRLLGLYNNGAKKKACPNYECNLKVSTDDLYIDMNLALTDETGTVTRCRLRGEFAEKTLGTTAGDLLELSEDEKCSIESVYFLEHCEIGLRIEHLPSRTTVDIIHLCRSDASSTSLLLS